MLAREEVVRVAADHVLDDPGGVDVVGLGLGDEAAVAQDDDAVGDLERLFEVVGDVDDRDAVGGEVAHDAEEHLDLGRAERGGRLVHDQDAGVLGERAGDLDDLLLAEAQVADLRARVQRLVEALQQLGGQLALRATGRP